MTNRVLEYTQDEKRAMYRTGQYVFSCPPVCTAHWNEYDWIRFIDTGRGWRPKVQQKGE